MSRNDSSIRSSSSDAEDAEIVYVKDNVTIHPTQYAAERISGRLKLIKQGSSLLMVMFSCCEVIFFLFVVHGLLTCLLWCHNRHGYPIKAKAQMPGCLQEVSFIFLLSYFFYVYALCNYAYMCDLFEIVGSDCLCCFMQTRICIP